MKTFNDLINGDKLYRLHYDFRTGRWIISIYVIEIVMANNSFISFEVQSPSTWLDRICFSRNEMDKSLVIRTAFNSLYTSYISPDIENFKTYLSNFKEDITECLNIIYKETNKNI